MCIQISFLYAVRISFFFCVVIIWFMKIQWISMKDTCNICSKYVVINYEHIVQIGQQIHTDTKEDKHSKWWQRQTCLKIAKVFETSWVAEKVNNCRKKGAQPRLGSNAFEKTGQTHKEHWVSAIDCFKIPIHFHPKLRLLELSLILLESKSTTPGAPVFSSRGQTKLNGQKSDQINKWTEKLHSLEPEGTTLNVSPA